MELFREELFARELARPEEQQLELEAGILRAFHVYLDPLVVYVPLDPLGSSGRTARIEELNPAGPPHPILGDDRERHQALKKMSHDDALHAVQELADRVMKVEVEAGQVFERLCLAWCELSLALIRADHQAPCYRAASIGLSLVPLTLNQHTRASVLRVAALAELFSLGMERADKMLFEAAEIDGDEGFAHLLISAALFFRTAPYREAIGFLDEVMAAAEHAGYLELDTAAARVIKIGAMR